MNIESFLSQEVQERLLERLRAVATSGTFKFFNKNLYTCLKVSNRYGTIAANMLAELGFHLTETHLKPGDPKTHISVINKYEQFKKLKREVAERVMEKWEKRGTIQFILFYLHIPAIILQIKQI